MLRADMIEFNQAQVVTFVIIGIIGYLARELHSKLKKIDDLDRKIIIMERDFATMWRNIDHLNKGKESYYGNQKTSAQETYESRSHGQEGQEVVDPLKV